MIILASCNSEPKLERYNVMGYSIGDTIDDGISIDEEYNEWLSYGIINEHERAKVWLFNKHIDRIVISSLSQREFDSLMLRISEIYELDPRYYKDTLSSGLIMKAEEYYWYDSVSGDDISILRDTYDNPDSTSSLWFENERISSEYKEQILGPEEEYEFTIISDDE